MGAHNRYGPFHWPKWYPQCDGKSQSPITIKGESATYQPQNTSYTISPGYMTESDKMYAENNGHTLQISSNVDFFINGFNLPNKYKVLQFHMHWGSSRTMNVGSEHYINGISFPLELHIVTFNKEKYERLDTTSPQNGPDTLAVFGLLFKQQKNDNPDLAQILKLNFSEIIFPGDKKIEFPAFPLNNLFNGFKTDQYFQYNGSLTTPGCQEIVSWTVFPFGPGVSVNQIAKLQTLSMTRDKMTPMVNNHRNPQSLNNRKVTRSFADFKMGELLSLSRGSLQSTAPSIVIISSVFMTLLMMTFH
ncbi:carbonic anhydrase 14-like isoform X2 [Tubulanus polymorphus]|uniref:carbonic anhydrase 14-like isoform X2 n=1 Tax=Tubulanus polymorphus TaxID=672921 RepID=UPI003DA4EEEF